MLLGWEKSHKDVGVGKIPLQHQGKCPKMVLGWDKSHNGIGEKSHCRNRGNIPKWYWGEENPMARLRTILEQRDRMIKQGKYTPPEHHMGKEEPRP
uniref:Uncharacterized protein n=1 Tax=Zonotrichia albicollis TaxID=44394 RepID=A0A8D2QGU8_ZONAL